MKRFSSFIALMFLTVLAHAVVVEGEITPGNYNRLKTDSSGNLYTITAAPTDGTLVDRSGTITAGGTAQTLAAVNSTRRYLFIQNVSTSDLWINFTTAAAQTQPSFKLIPNSSFVMEGAFITSEAVSIIGATTGQAFVSKEY